jgi:G protein-coupled receptor Mth (Methuselah protein)
MPLLKNTKYSQRDLGFWSELLYFDGPVVVLLALNVALFSLTARRLWRLKREAAQAFKSSSIRVVAPAGNRQHKDRFTLYVKLFLLMGVTWIMEVVSWAAGGPDTLWYLTDTVNCLRGVLIFWFCVWSNKAVRKVFLNAFTCSKHRTVQSDSRYPSPGASLSSSSTALSQL